MATEPPDPESDDPAWIDTKPASPDLLPPDARLSDPPSSGPVDRPAIKVAEPPDNPGPTANTRSPDELLNDAPVTILTSPLGEEPLDPVLRVAEPEEPDEVLVSKERVPDAPVLLRPDINETLPPSPDPLSPAEIFTSPPDALFERPASIEIPPEEP